MNNYQIAILVTTFLRDELLFSTLNNIKNNMPNNSVILIADYGRFNEKKDNYISNLKRQISCEHYRLPFDSGLSAGRNFLVQKASEMNLPYCLLMADSIQFLVKYNFNSIIQFLELEEKRGLVGFQLENSKCSWEYLMTLTPNGFKFDISDQHYFFENIKFTKIDICRNIFLAKTSTLKNLWNEDLKLAEHEIAFLEYKKRGYESFWTDSFIFKKILDTYSEEYETYRNRFKDYRKLMQKKLDIVGWVIYPNKK